jgi:hypothetical protein
VSLNTPPIDWFGLSPILTLTGAAFLALLCAVLVPRTARRAVAAGFSFAGFTAGLVLAIWLYVDSADGHTIAAGAFYRDRWTALGQIILVTTTWRSSSHSCSPRPRGWRSSSARRT